ncbi:MAG: hypothetical protein AB7K04_10920, partial [Pseudorhodoplanes sp.]
MTLGRRDGIVRRDLQEAGVKLMNIRSLLSAFAFALAGVAATAAQAQQGPLVSAEWVELNLKNPKVRV